MIEEKKKKIISSIKNILIHPISKVLNGLCFITRAGRDLIDSEHRLRCFFNAAFEGMAITEKGVLIDCNERFVEMFGYSREFLIGTKVVDIVYPDDRELVKKNMEQEHTASYEHRVSHKDGSICYVEVHGQKSQLLGRDVRITVIHDITERKEAEDYKSLSFRQQKEASKMEAIGSFAAGIAHDFNNALSPIIGNCEIMLLNMEETNPLRSKLVKMLAAADTASRLVHRIQSFTSKNGKGGEKLLPMRLGGCITETYEFIRSMTPASINIEMSIDEELGVVNVTDVTIRQVLMNLCKNSAQAMIESEGSIYIRAQNDVVNVSRYGIPVGEYVRLEVEDDGVGMSQEVMDRALNPYFSTTKDRGGTGIGLSVVNGIVANYNGFIQLYSRVGEGTRVVVYIPITDAEPSKIVDCGLSDDVKIGNNQRILLVDDHESVMDAVSQILESLNYRVKAYVSSLEALEELTAHPNDYDVLVTDLTMPDMTGVVLIKEVKKIKPDLKVVLCSGLGSNKQYGTDEVSKADGLYLAKPATRLEYGKVLAEIFEAS